MASFLRSLLLPVALFSLPALAGGVVETLEPEKSYETKLPLPELATFTVTSNVASIEVVPTDGAELEVHAQNGSSKARLEIVPVTPSQWKVVLEAEPIQVSLGNVFRGSNVVIGGSIVGSVVIGNVSGGSVVVGGGRPLHLRLGVPREKLAHLKVQTGQGEVSVTDFESEPPGLRRVVKLKSAQGSVTTRRLVASAEIGVETSQGAVSLSQVRSTGPVRVVSGQGSVSVRKSVAAFFYLRSSQGKVAVGDSRGNVVAESAQGKVEASGNEGNIEATSQQGKVVVTGQRGGAVRARSSMGKIELDNPDATVEDAKTRMGTVSGVRKPGTCPDLVADAAEETAVFDY